MTRTALLLSALLALGMPALAQSPECRRDLLVADTLLPQARDRLMAAQGRPPAELCQAYRELVTAAERVSAIQSRCGTGADKASIIADMKATAAETRAALADRCKGK